MRDDADRPTIISDAGHDGSEGPSMPEPGRGWGKFLIEKHLGSGGQAEVFQAFDRLGTAGHVALKVPSVPLNPEQVEQWVDVEAAPLLKLQHPNIVRVTDAGRVGYVPYVATELLQGLPLNEHVRMHPPSVRQVADWTVQLTDALDAAHQQGILHRDVKPRNVIIGPDGRPRLIDFGLASLVTAYSPEHRRDTSGTYPFMAPEQARGGEEADHRADIFGLGGLLKYLLVGQGPYHGADDPVAAAREGQVSMLDVSGSGTRRALCRIANRAMSPDPAQRYQSAGRMAAALRRARARTVLLRLGAAATVLAGVAALILTALKGAEQGPVRATLEVRLQHEGQTGSYLVLTADSVPLGAGDRIQLRAEFSEPVYAYLVAASPETGVQLLYPAEGAGAERVTELHFPSAETWHDLPTAGETWTLAVLAARRPVSDAAGRVEHLGPAPQIDGAAMLVLDERGLQLIPSARARLAGREGAVREGFLAPLSQSLPAEWAAARAVALPYWASARRAGALAEMVRARMPMFGPRPPGQGPPPRSPVTVRYVLADHEPGQDSYYQFAPRQVEVGAGGPEAGALPSPSGYVEVGFAAADAVRERTILGAAIRGLRIEDDPRAFALARLIIHTDTLATDARYQDTAYRVSINGNALGGATSAGRGEQKEDAYDMNPTLLAQGPQTILLNYNGARMRPTATRIDWVEIQLLPAE